MTESPNGITDRSFNTSYRNHKSKFIVFSDHVSPTNFANNMTSNSNLTTITNNITTSMNTNDSNRINGISLPFSTQNADPVNGDAELPFNIGTGQALFTTSRYFNFPTSGINPSDTTTVIFTNHNGTKTRGTNNPTFSKGDKI